MSDPSDDVERFIGTRLREMREKRALSQIKLGARIGAQAEIIDAYEQGHSPIPASTLFALAGALGTSVNSFFSHLEKAEADSAEDADNQTMIVEMSVYKGGRQLADGCFSLYDEAALDTLAAFVKPYPAPDNKDRS